MSFFIRNQNQRGAKRKNGTTPDSGRPKTYKEKKRLAKDDEISSHSEGEDEAVDDSKEYSGSEDADETVQEKRLRLTKEYLKEIENQGTYVFLNFIHFLIVNQFSLPRERTKGRNRHWQISHCTQVERRYSRTQWQTSANSGRSLRSSGWKPHKAFTLQRPQAANYLHDNISRL